MNVSKSAVLEWDWSYK